MVFANLFSKRNELDELKKKLDAALQELNICKKSIQEKGLLLEEKNKEVDRLKAEKESLLHKLKEETVFPLLERPSINYALKYTLELIKDSRKAYRKEIEGSEADTIIFTHHDGDGVCCGALCERYFSGNSDKKIFHISQGDRYLIRKVTPKKMLIAADLVLDNELTEHLSDLTKRGIEVKWVDHHKESLDFCKDLPDYLKDKVVVKNARSAASLVYDYLGLNDDVSRRIKLIGDRCDGEKRTNEEVKEDAIILNKLARLSEPVVSRARRELAHHGSIKSDELKQKAAVVDLLTAYGEKIVKERLFYETNDFQVYCLTDAPYLVGIGHIASRIGTENRKDVYTIVERNGVTTVKGKAKFGADRIFPKIAESLGGVSYSCRHIGGCTFNGKVNPKRLVDILKELYDHEELLKDIYTVVNSPLAGK
ncbi:MAG: hypothetical protein ACP5O8_00975 [Candidatus Aenigmatarchaeota archaeon]